MKKPCINMVDLNDAISDYKEIRENYKDIIPVIILNRYTGLVWCNTYMENIDVKNRYGEDYFNLSQLCGDCSVEAYAYIGQEIIDCYDIRGAKRGAMILKKIKRDINNSQYDIEYPGGCSVFSGDDVSYIIYKGSINLEECYIVEVSNGGFGGFKTLPEVAKFLYNEGVAL